MDISKELVPSEKYIIFCSDTDDKTTEKYLQGLQVKYIHLLSRFQGEDETSFIINLNNKFLIENLIENQEVTIELSEVKADGERLAAFRIKYGSLVPMGHLHETNKERAEKEGAFIYNPFTESYFVVQ